MSGSKRKAAESTDTSQDLSSSCEIPRERKTELLKKARSKAKKNRRDPGTGMSIKAHFSVAKDSTAASSATGTDSASDIVGGSERRDTETVSNADLLKKLCEMSEQLAKVNVSVEELRGEIFEVKQENSVLRKDLEKCQKNLQRAEEVAAEAKTLAAIAERRVNDLEQYGRRNNVRILGVPESKGEDCEKQVLDIFRKNLRLRDMGNMDIEAAHRVGQHPQSQRGPQQKSPKARPIIVRFVNRKAADTVLYNRRMLKGTAFVITEDLTRANFALLNYCWDHPEVDDAWSKRGAIYAKRGSRIRKIECKSDLPDLPLDASTPHTQRHRRQRARVPSQELHTERSTGTAATTENGNMNQSSPTDDETRVKHV
ncbi:hypothetical protein BaRGS_00024715 [Batillaria attramentaria]|uniref:Uncharacterized protein n=1 Tax=Batillaria attramentaria TaxID=370345 RepID=A0ABD0KAH1_9CAEN